MNHSADILGFGNHSTESLGCASWNHSADILGCASWNHSADILGCASWNHSADILGFDSGVGGFERKRGGRSARPYRDFVASACHGR